MSSAAARPRNPLTAPLQTLGDRPVLGVSLAGVSVLRLDCLHAAAPGNKWFKLQPLLAQAEAAGVRRLVSFGGAWSNHLHALAACGRAGGFETVGLVRGEPGEADTDMLADARAWGMRIIRIPRSEYRRRNEPAYLDGIEEHFAPCRVIPEGGAEAAGARGCLAIAGMLRGAAPGARRVVVPVGTGTTLAGVAAGLDPDWRVTGVAALRGAADLQDRVARALAACDTASPARWSVDHEGHCGGFARVSDGLREFMLAFEEAHAIPLDPVYTAKSLFLIHGKVARGEWSCEELIAIHTGGLQGRRGFSFLREPGPDRPVRPGE